MPGVYLSDCLIPGVYSQSEADALLSSPIRFQAIQAAVIPIKPDNNCLSNRIFLDENTAQR
jgi:hypothetical protein